MAASSLRAIFAGSFDPITLGHLDLVAKASRVFDHLTVAVVVNPNKRPMFSTDERVSMIRALVGDWPNVEVDAFEGLLVDYLHRRGATVIVRGLRTPAEFSDESQMALMNRHLAPTVETVFMLPDARVAHISSRFVKEVAGLGGSLDGLVPPAVAARMATRGR